MEQSIRNYTLNQQDENQYCLTLSEGKQVLLLDFDVSTSGEMVSGYIIIVILLTAIIYQALVAKKTVQCMKNSQSSLRYLLLVQIASMMTLISQLSSLILNTSYYFVLQSNPQNYNKQNIEQSSLYSVLTAYDVIQTLSVLFYIITYYLALNKWLEILRITAGTRSNIRIFTLAMHFIFICAIVLMLINMILIGTNTELTLDHYFISGSILLTGAYTVYLTYMLTTNIEYIYEIDYQFKRKLKIQLSILAIACVIRSIFNLILMLVEIKCYKYGGDEGRLENTNVGWSIVFPFLVIANNSAVILFSVLFSPGKKFRQNNIQENYHSLNEDN